MCHLCSSVQRLHVSHCNAPAYVLLLISFSHIRLPSYLRISRCVRCGLLDVQEPPRLVTGRQGQGIFGRNATTESYPRDT